MSHGRTEAGRRAALGILAVAVVVGAASAQTPFALTNIGQNIDAADARDTGRGGWGAADVDTLTPGFANPAAVADTRLLLVLFSGFGASVRSEGDGAERHTYRTILPEFRLVIPISSGRLAAHAGFHLERSLQYRTLRDAEWESGGETIPGRERFRREGTFYSIPLGVSLRLARRVALSGSVNLVRGAVSEEMAQFYTLDEGVDYLPSIRTQEDDLSGTSGTFGLLLGPFGPVALGAVYTTAYELDMARTISLEGVGPRGHDAFTLKMPAEMRGGLRLDLFGPWQLGCDGELARYSELEGYEPWQRDARDEWILAAGFEKQLTRSRRGGRSTPPFRFGFSWRRWAYQVGGAPVDEKTVSVGTGFPFRGKLGMIDLALSYSFVGELEKNGYESRIWRLGISVIGLERMDF